MTDSAKAPTTLQPNKPTQPAVRGATELQAAYDLRTRMLGVVQGKLFAADEELERLRTETALNLEALRRQNAALREAADAEVENSRAAALAEIEALQAKHIADQESARTAFEVDRASLFQSMMRRDVELSNTKAALAAVTEKRDVLLVREADRFDEIAYLTKRLMEAEALSEKLRSQQNARKVEGDKLQREVTRLKRANAKLTDEVNQLGERVRSLTTSTSWKITAPMRWVVIRMRKLKG